jgi:signal transduction histidine kinase
VQALRREQDALLQAAVARQRVAMSRELHDIAAHHMSGIALMAAAMDRQIDSDPAAAKRSARQVREQSSAVLDDLRRLVGLLREDADAARPVETLDAVSALVEARRAAGAEIDLVLPAERQEVGPLAQLVAYRMVQESLANAAAHAPGARCVVEIGEPRGGRLAITVRNGPPTGPDPGPGSGFGLVGMAERAQLVGGDLTCGATPDGGWEVRLTLPVEDPISTVGAPAPLPEAPA